MNCHGHCVIKGGGPKFGVQHVELYAGIGDDVCFGSTRRHCDFDVIASLKQANLRFKPVCVDKLDGNIRLKAYELNAKNKSSTYLLEMTDGGSGGMFTTLDLFYLEDEKQFCNQIETRLF